MIILANLLAGISTVLGIVFQTVLLLVFLRAILSWVNPDPYNPIVRFLHGMTEPLLQPLRRFIPPVGGRIDVTPLVLLIVIYFLQSFLLGTLNDYVWQLKLSSMSGPVTK